jgi:hypothetical protein
MKAIIFFTFIALNTNAEETKKNVIYKYKDYESIDLGSLEIKGRIIAPGDLTVSERDRKAFERQLLEKTNFDQENKREIYNLR